jgi:hypothetical protein
MCELSMMQTAFAAMLIRLSEPDLVEEFCANFRRAGFAAGSAGGSMAEVYRLDAPAPDQEKREVEIHLRVWRATHPEAVTEIVP